MAVENPQRVLIHGINFWPELIGVGRFTGELADYLADRGHRVEAVTAAPHYPGWYVRPPYRSGWFSSEQRGRVKIIRAPMLLNTKGTGFWRLLMPLSFSFCAAAIVLWRSLRLRPDVVFCVE